MKIQINFKHRSMKNYWSDKKYTKNSFLLELEKNDTLEDILRKAEFKILDITEILYPAKNGSGYDTLNEYEIINVIIDPYEKKKKITNINIYSDKFKDINYLELLKF